MITSDEVATIIALDRPSTAIASVGVSALADSVISKYLAARASGAGKPAGKGKGGIMSKLVRMLMTASYRSPYRFWLSSCVETFLRFALLAVCSSMPHHAMHATGLLASACLSVHAPFAFGRWCVFICGYHYGEQGLAPRGTSLGV
jgi:hypothetical protein